MFPEKWKSADWHESEECYVTQEGDIFRIGNSLIERGPVAGRGPASNRRHHEQDHRPYLDLEHQCRGARDVRRFFVPDRDPPLALLPPERPTQ